MKKIKSLIKKLPFILNIYVKHLERKEKRIYLKECKSFYKSLNVKKRSVFLIGTPTHTNVGDSAIAIAERDFLKNSGIKVENIKEISLSEFNSRKEFLIKVINKSKCLVCLLGGGNMGNQWICEELPRQKMISGFKNNKIIVFPQTIFYSEDEKGKTEAERSIQIYNDKKNLTIVAREKPSFDIMKKLYPETKILLTPDIVLSTSPDTYNLKEQERKGVLFVIRNDVERSVDGKEWDNIIKYVKDNSIEYRITDMHSDKLITKENRCTVVRDKMMEFASSELVITDRLHGMVFAAISGTPCIVFGNYNHKVKGTYDWISYLPYIKFVETSNQAIKFIPEMLEMKGCKFDNKPLIPYFEQLKDIVKVNV